MRHAHNGSRATLLTLLLGIGLTACSVVPPADFPRVSYVDIKQFMGPWYVIATIPPSQTANAYNALECYAQVAPGVIATTFTYRDGSFAAEQQRMTPTGYVIEGTGGAIWGMQFFWPLKMQYVITYLGADYTTVIVARSDLDYAWIMARTPQIADATYAALVQRVADLGYDMTKLRKVPQQPISQRSDGC